MADNTVKFTINIDGNAYAGVVKMDKAFENLTASVKSNLSFMDKFGGLALKFNMITDALGKVRDVVSNTIKPFIEYDSQLHELSAITGVTGNELKAIGSLARKNASIFGGSAGASVRSYSLLLSQLSPEIAENSEALAAMGRNVSVLSKSMGGDATAATEVLTTAMNQYGVDLRDPIKASQTMADMMNVMSAAANVGSAELPQIKDALSQSGMAAKGAGVSFEELNAAIQVLDKAGKKGAEGGVAVRNVLLELSRGRFQGKQVKEALEGAGISVEQLADKSLSLTDRLRMLKPIQDDTALMTAMFGTANTNAANALMNGIDTIDQYTQAISGTNSAEEYAATIMESYEERQNRVNAAFDNLKISIFSATGSLGFWVTNIIDSLVPLSQVLPLLKGIGTGLITTTKFIKLQSKALWKNTTAWWANVAGQGGFLGMSIPTVTGMNIVTIAATAMWSAIMGPVGLIILAIAAVVAVVAILWNKCEGFRKVVFGVWESIKAIFYNIGVVLSALWNNIIKPIFSLVWSFVKTVFTGIWEAAKWCFDGIVSAVMWLWDGIVRVATAIGDFFAGVWGWITETAVNAFDWIVEKLGVVGTWIKEHLVDPIRDAFAAVWDFIRGIFNKIISGLGKLFEPIKELWNKIFPKDQFKSVSAAYIEGEEKGAKSWEESQKKKKEEKEKPASSILEPKDGGGAAGGGSSPLDGGSMGAAAGSSAGKAQQINIKLENFVGTMRFEGGLRENRAEIESTLREMMARVLGMAETAV